MDDEIRALPLPRGNKHASRPGISIFFLIQYKIIHTYRICLMLTPQVRLLLKSSRLLSSNVHSVTSEPLKKNHAFW